jgi:hypothetical protein
MALASAAEHYATQKAIADRAMRRGLSLWGGSAFMAASALAELQAESATAALAAVESMLAEQDLDAPATGEIDPMAFAGPGTALVREATGPASMARLLGTLTADAGRSATGVSIAARPAITGHVRYLSPPSCARCAILAGRFYRWSSGFQRHPRCDCQMIPTTQAAAPGLISNPNEAFENGQIRGLSKKDAQAITDGADISQVVNAKRGVYTADVFGHQFKATLAGTTSRGVAGRRMGDLAKDSTTKRYRRSQTPRPTPAAIYKIAVDRDDAIRLLTRFGYIL